MSKAVGLSVDNFATVYQENLCSDLTVCVWRKFLDASDAIEIDKTALTSSQNKETSSFTPLVPC